MSIVEFEEEKINNRFQLQVRKKSKLTSFLIDKGVVKDETMAQNVLIGFTLLILFFSGYLYYIYVVGLPHRPTAQEKIDEQAYFNKYEKGKK